MNPNGKEVGDCKWETQMKRRRRGDKNESAEEVGHRGLKNGNRRRLERGKKRKHK